MADVERSAGTPPLATPPNPLAEATVAFVQTQFGAEVVEVSEHRGETTIVLRPQAIEPVCRALRDAPDLQYNYLADLTAVDWPDRDPRYDVVYHLLSLTTRAVVRLKARVGDEDTPNPELPTVTTVWPAANFFEREVFDLFGIRFSGHPNLTRILLPNDWVGHPLRKDYPLTGIALPDPHWGGQVPFDATLPPGTGNQTLRSPQRTLPVIQPSGGPPARNADE